MGQKTQHQLSTGLKRDADFTEPPMPYASKAQQRFAHTDTAKAKGFPTQEFDMASRGMKLPERSAGTKKLRKGRSVSGRR